MNYMQECERIITETPKGASLLLHSCCAPCSSHVIYFLSSHFSITVFYYNPNITEKSEYLHRVAEQQKLISAMPTELPVSFIEGDYDSGVFFDTVKGYEKDREGGTRCQLCYDLRIRKTAETAKENGFEYITTTLSISPLKSSSIINEIGFAVSRDFNVKWLPSDFKKKDGFKHSIELSKQYNLYRQNYCGCIFSKNSNPTR